jgi:hypothetical protein
MQLSMNMTHHTKAIRYFRMNMGIILIRSLFPNTLSDFEWFSRDSFISYIYKVYIIIIVIIIIIIIIGSLP